MRYGRRRSRAGGPIRTFGMLLMLTVVWLLWSGLTIVVDPGGDPALSYNGMLIAFMIGSVGFTVLVLARMDNVDREASPWYLTGRFAMYFPWLLKEIVMSNLHVAQVILDPDLPIHPQLVRVRTTQQTDLGHVIHANSITITPGTISLDVRNGNILVHALTNDTADGVMSGEMDQRVSWVEGA